MRSLTTMLARATVKSAIIYLTSVAAHAATTQIYREPDPSFSVVLCDEEDPPADAQTCVMLDVGEPMMTVEDLPEARDSLSRSSVPL